MEEQRTKDLMEYEIQCHSFSSAGGGAFDEGDGRTIGGGSRSGGVQHAGKKRIFHPQTTQLEMF